MRAVGWAGRASAPSGTGGFEGSPFSPFSSCSSTNGSSPSSTFLARADVQGALPAGDGEDGDAVAEQVGGDAHRVHDAVHAEEQGDGSDGDGAERGGGRRQGEERRTRHARHALAGQHQHQYDGDLLAQGEVDADGLGDEERADGEVDRGAVEVEGVAGRQDQADRVVAGSRLAQLLHHARHDGLAGRGAEREQHLLAV